ncbi:hypothetical protein ABBQ38_002622 [Trebouxia sp. C0009 RCD-2024]
MSPATAARVVAVTGVSGYIGSEVVKQLLEKGYTVRGTVRSKANTSKVQHLLKLSDALPGNLELFEADLLKVEDFDEVVRGADYVLHTASPVFTETNDPQKDLVDPAVNGTTNVLNAAGKAGVKKIVLTSSVAAVRSGKFTEPPVNGKLYTEEDWNKTSTLQEEPYNLSKTLAEKAAWDLSKKHGFQLVTINPAFVFGPVLSPRIDAMTVLMMKSLLEGKTDEFPARVCDVRDVARAHVRAIEDPSASGRHIISQPNNIPSQAIVDILQKRFPSNTKLHGKDGDSSPIMDNSKALKLLGGLHPVSETMVDMAVTMIQLGVFKAE